MFESALPNFRGTRGSRQRGDFLRRACNALRTCRGAAASARLSARSLPHRTRNWGNPSGDRAPVSRTRERPFIIRALKPTCRSAHPRTNRLFDFPRNRVIYSAERKQPMDPTKPKLPVEAIQLYNRFIHGEIGRRDFMDGVKRFAIGGLAVSAIVEALMPNYALGQQVAPTDNRIKATYETVPSPQGNGSIKGYLVRPVSADTREAMPSKLPGIIVVHENRGLNPHIEDIARRFALANFMAFAPDGLTSVGGFPGDDYRGGQLFGKVDRGKMTEDMVASAKWLKARPDCTGKIGATGFCYGGGIANTLAFRLGPDMGAAGPVYRGP